MEAFDYVAPRSLPEVYALLGNGKRSQFLAGGTDIIVQLRERRKSCARTRRRPESSIEGRDERFNSSRRRDSACFSQP